MLKGIGAVFVLAGCLGIGLWYKCQFEGRIRMLKELDRSLELLCGEIDYGRGTLPESCMAIARRLQEPLRSAFLHMGEKRPDGESFGEVFRKNLEPVLDQSPLTVPDKEIFFRCLSDQGVWDGRMQQKTIDRSRRELAETVERLEREAIQRGRMYLGLGAMSGVVIILVLC